jgi:two-component system, chemotaxis family, chemotaxis protein CheY
MRCLVVDDDDIGRLMLTSFLAEFYTCDQATNGQEAIDLVEQAWSAGTPYDFICLDIIMPVMDGSTALRQIRERDEQQGRRTKVFMISACSTPQDIEDAFFEGDCDDYVVKPFHREAVAQMLIRHKLS